MSDDLLTLKHFISSLCFHSSDMNDLMNIRRITGICPQHDVIFTLLTPREHLSFFARIRVRNVFYNFIFMIPYYTV